MLHDVQYMPSNPHNTISPSALKNLDGFINAAHDCGTNMYLKHTNGTSHYFRSKTDMEWINGMDYLPLLVTSLPLHTTSITQTTITKISSAATRSSTATNRTNLKRHDSLVQPSNISQNIIKSPIQTRARTSYRDQRDIGRIQSQHVSRKISSLTTNKVSPVPISTPHEISDNISESAFLAHLKFGCRCHKTIAHMSKLKIMTNMPFMHTAKLHKWKCPICAIMKVPRLASNLNTALLNLAPGQMFHIDFAFMSEVSIRGFSSYLSFLDDTT
jgi:hypothetical protein